MRLQGLFTELCKARNYFADDIVWGRCPSAHPDRELPGSREPVFLDLFSAGTGCSCCREVAEL